ncbi:LINE-1 type transposase domain-containing protein 1 isoform X1 [Mustela nigripes]|uniref:LINE-1 type transposase domain-containing protein 1 isoform X1 n=1 Tax=Mustela nigripes TaxID=77151 RepID=UPI002815BF9A|nr:LINE-1 type transposase domain-containing protein 1 isoform X1 [Mustela nigripes]
MSIVESEIARLAKKQENSTHRERIHLIETDQEMAQVLDIKCKDLSAVMLMKFKGLMEDLDLMVDEIRESLKKDLKEMLGVESKMPEVKNINNCNTKKELQQIKGLAMQKTGLLEKIVGANSEIVEPTEKLTSKRKEVSKPSNQLDRVEEYSTDQGKELPHDKLQNDKVMGSVEEAISNLDNNCKEHSIHMEVTREIGEDELVKEKVPQNSKNTEKIIKTSREDEGAILTLAADFSSATLDISKQWSNVFSILRENDFEPKVLCQVKLILKCDGEVRTFADMQSLSNFTSQKPFLKELLKDVLPQKEKIKKGRRYGIQEKVEKTLLDSKHGAEREASDGLSFLFVKEVKVAEPEEVNNLETQEEEASELEEEGEEASELDEEEEASGLEEEDEETSELEEEDEEETSGLEEEGEEKASVLCEKQDSAFQCHSVVNTKCEAEEKSSNGLEVVSVKEVEDSELEEEEGSEWEMEVVLSWEEGEDSEVESVKTASQIEKKGALDELNEIAYDYLAQDFEKKKLVKHQMVQKTQNKEEMAVPKNQGVGTVCPTLTLASPSKSLEISSVKQKRQVSTNLSTPSGINKFLRKTEKERHKTLLTDKRTSKETDLIQETEEDFRRNVINSFRELQEEVENIKNYLPEVLGIKNTVVVLNSRIDTLEERMDNLEDRIEEFSKDTVQMAKQIINKERSRDIEDRSRSSNIRLIGIPEKSNKENGAEEIIKEIIEENFPELKDSSLEVVSAYRIPSKIDEKRLTPRHILVKFGNSTDKEKILKASRKREITYRGTRIRLTADLSLDTLDARSQWSNVIKVLQAKGFTPRILYPAKLAFDFEGKTKTFFDTEEFTKFVSSIPSLKELLDDIL